MADAVDKPLQRVAPGAHAFGCREKAVPVGLQHVRENAQATGQTHQSLGFEKATGEIAADQHVLAFAGDDRFAKTGNQYPIYRSAAGNG